MSLDCHQRDWEDLSALDPHWAILSEPTKQNGGWSTGEMFAAGRVDVEALMTRSGELGYPILRVRALDFGCGIGRKTRALTEHFDQVLGIDIAKGMAIDSIHVNGHRLIDLLRNPRVTLT